MSRPYFELEVVKVGKKKKIGPPILIGSYCPICGARTELEKPKGNWINGENLDKIKFPCFCSFKAAKYNYRSFGELDLIVYRDYEFYRIRELKQVDKKLVYGKQWIKTHLKDIIKWFEVKILKGKITIYEEE